MLERPAAFIAMLSAACALDLPDQPGLACDDQHPCETGRACVDGICGMFTPRVWQQSADGFSSMDVLSGATLSIGAGNAVVSTVPSANDLHDRATAIASASLPINGDGHLKGTVHLPAPLQLKGRSTWLYLGTSAQEVLSLAFDSSGELVCGTQRVAVPGTDFDVDVTWKHGEYQRLSLNGMPVVEGERDAGVVVPDQLRLGIFGYDGSSDAGWSITLTGFTLSDTP